MTETPVAFGPQSTLWGMLTQPADAGLASMAVLMFNAGVIPRVGPHRLNVKLARALARAGTTSLRFDLAGQGDSRGTVAGGDFEAQATHDIRCAMDHLEQTQGITRFVLIGICSGAIHALGAACVDPRVVGLLMFDGHWFRTRWTLPVRHWKRFRATSWRDAAAAVKRRLVGGLAPTAEAGGAGLFDADNEPPEPPRADFVRDMQALADRRVATWIMYSGSVIDYYSYAGQFRDEFGHEAFFDKVRCDFRPDIDHTFVSIDVQRRFIDAVLGWVAETRPAWGVSA